MEWLATYLIYLPTLGSQGCILVEGRSRMRCKLQDSPSAIQVFLGHLRAAREGPGSTRRPPGWQNAWSVKILSLP